MSMVEGKARVEEKAWDEEKACIGRQGLEKGPE
jgi:hypothetical protein